MENCPLPKIPQGEGLGLKKVPQGGLLHPQIFPEPKDLAPNPLLFILFEEK